MAYNADLDTSRTPDFASQPASNAFVIDPSDTVDLAVYAKSIYVGVGGDISLIPKKGDVAIVFKNVPDGAILPIQVKRVTVADTNANNIIGFSE